MYRKHPQLATATTLILLAGCTDRTPSNLDIPRPRSGAPSALRSLSSVGPLPTASVNTNGEITIDFEGLADETPVTNQYAELGVTFSSATVLVQGGDLNSANFPPRSGRGVIYDAPSGTITASFESPVQSVGGYITGNRVITLSCFDKDNHLLGTSQTPGANYTGAGTGIPSNYLVKVEASGIRRCTFRDGGNTFTIDDFTFKKGCELFVGRESQTDQQWGGNSYDHTDKTVAKLGCALTSLAMAITYSGWLTDPGSLNTFMTKTDHDYSGSSVNWSAAVRDWTQNTRYFKWLSANTAEALERAVCAGFPVVVGVNGNTHFVLVTGKRGDQFLINDPGYSSRTTLDAYGNQFSVRGAVVPLGVSVSFSRSANGGPRFAQMTQVSKGELNVAVRNATLLMTAPTGERTGADSQSNTILREIPGSAFARDALTDDETGESVPGFTSIINVFAPVGGTYGVRVFGTSYGVTSLMIRTFSADGASQPPLEILVVTAPGSVSTLELAYNPESTGTATVRRSATFASALTDVDALLRSGHITNAGVANSLSQKLSRAQASESRGATGAAAGTLNALLSEINAQRGVHLSNTAGTILIEDAQFLLAHLGS